MPREEREGKKFWGRRRTALLAIFILGILAGAAAMHYLIEPMLAENISSKFEMCITQRDVLDARYIECAENLSDANAMLRTCQYELQQCRGA